MPAQKRRIFQIRQRQNRREKRRKTRIALQKEQNPLLKQLDVLGMRLFEGYKNWNANNPPSSEDISSIRRQMQELKPIMNQFGVATLRSEKIIGKEGAGWYRHDPASRVTTIYTLCEKIDKKCGTNLKEALRE